jgi:DNA-directed RNA polymerase subunit beta
MNVGQVFECLLGLAGEKLGNRFKVTPFDEIYGKEASRVLVNQN